jgi:uncharacterized protein YggT (Ycf19 family)
MRTDSVTGLVFHRGMLVRSKIFVRSIQILAAIFGIIYLLLGTRFLLTYVGANRSAGFAQFIWEWTASLYAPFRHLLGAGSDPGGHPIEWSLLIAMGAYGVLHFLLRKGIMALARPRIDRDAD